MGCRCRNCKEAESRARRLNGPNCNNNMGKVQNGAVEKGWSMGSDEGSGDYLRPAERADRHEREQHGRNLPAAYRHLIGLTPQCKAGDRVTARAYLTRIEAAIEHGGWTRSEWRRLYKLRDKWQARATGRDPRYDEIGNASGGVRSDVQARIHDRRLVNEMRGALERDFDRKGSRGD